MASEENRVASSRVLTADQRREFEETGLLHLPGAIPEEHTREMCDRLWEELATRYQIRRVAPETWKEGQIFALHGPERAGAFATMASATLCQALDDLFAPYGWQRPARWGSPLVNFPFRQHQWDVPHANWHLDIFGELGLQPVLEEVTVFAFLDTLLPEAGATVAVTGSHRLVQELSAGRKSKLRSKEGRKLLEQSHAWLKDLLSAGTGEARKQRFMHDGSVVRGIPLRVVEIIGAPGDVVVMHPAILHTAAANCGTTPRLALRQGIQRGRH
ncbi:MAG TPA: phytanoyl-CoA dioxygenase family protein [Candidatus Binataceae bacterium]|nr:phytanoyl-CoA dioxygenase family protein [Candidatus Binataceae bacterium]